MSSRFPRKRTVAGLRDLAEKRAKNLSKKQKLDPVETSKRTISDTFWGRAWCKNIESYQDYENRLPRGRSYLKHGCVIDLTISEGRIDCLVSGSELYEVEISMKELDKQVWQELVGRCSKNVGSLVELMSGNLSDEVMSFLTDKEAGLFPHPCEISMQCNCLDWSDMCKHLAAAMYGVAVRLDAQPELLFTLRGVDSNELVNSSKQSFSRSIDRQTQDFDVEELEGLFGIEIDL